MAPQGQDFLEAFERERDERDSALMHDERLRQLEAALRAILEIADAPNATTAEEALTEIGNIAGAALGL